jgi:hypothetical protein
MRTWLGAIAILGSIMIVNSADAASEKPAKQKGPGNCAAQINAKFGNNLDPQTRRMRAAAFQRCQRGEPI